MPKLILSLCFLLLTTSVLLATHSRGGYIEYYHVTGLVYQARIVTHTKISPPSNQADRNELPLDWGDGSPIAMIARTSQTLIAPDIQENVYEGTHSYTSLGTYTLSVSDPNRNDMILNINNGNSIGLPFYIESTLSINTANPINNSASLLQPLVMTAQVGQVFSYTPTAYDPDGDILHYTLVTPKQDRNTAVLGYEQITDVGPGLNNNYTFDEVDGTLTWDAPQLAGEYTLAVLIRQYRDCELVGSMLVDFQVIVYSRLLNSEWMLTSNVIGDTITPNTPLEIRAVYKDSSVGVNLAAYSETLTLTGMATSTPTSINSNQDSIVFRWTPTTSDVRCAPYILTFRGTSEYTEHIDQNRSVKIYVRDQTTTGCDTLYGPSCFVSISKLPNASNIKVSLHPNPFQQQCTFQIDSEHPEQAVQLSIFNAFGQQVFVQSFYGTTYELDNRALAAGVYFYAVQLQDGSLVTGKMVKL
jgi:hypothetical protein